MQRLSQNSLATAVTRTVNACDGLYSRERLQPGIVHFGVGNFHRCHQAVYVHKLLSGGDLDWGIVGISMRSANLRDQLAPQDFLYTEVTLCEESEFRVVGSLLNILVAPENPAAVIDQVADSAIKLVTSTITEKGYCLASGQIDTDHPKVVSDRASLRCPQTIYGYLAAAIIQRHDTGAGPLSVLCCDNIQGGGEHLCTGVHMLLQEHDMNSVEWATEHISFASSMVDRVSPATDESLRRLVRTTLELDDAWPVSAEPFSQWVIEDNFAAQRPPLDKVGALYADDITLFEQMKLRFLNAGHSIISVLGYLDNQATIHQALQQASILDFTQRVLYENVLPVVRIPFNYTGENYISEIMQRFANSALPYVVQQVNTDSSQKIQQRWFPTIDDALAQNASTAMLSFSVAAWVHYILKALELGELNDPLSDSFLTAHQQSSPHPDYEVVKQFLTIAGAERFNFFNSPSFMASVLSHYRTLMHTDITSALSQFLSRGEKIGHA